MRTWRFRTALLAVVVGLAACGGGDSPGPSGPNPPPPPPPPPPGPAPVATVEVTLPAGLLIGDTATAVVVLKDAQGNVLTGRAVTFTSSGAAATVNGSGLVTAVSEGGPVTITATSEGRSGTAPVTVRDDQRFAYVWAHAPTNPAYTPNHAWVYNSTGGAVNISRSGTGVYAVRFVGQGAQPGQRENLQVTAYDGVYYCNLAGWQTEGADLVANVRCFAPDGNPTDGMYTVLLTGARALGGRLGFALANQSAAASYTPARVHNSGYGPVTVTRNNPGVYTARFTGLGRGATSGPEQVMVTMVGAGSDRCVVSSWNEVAFLANIACTDRTGAPADAQFSLLVLERGRPGKRIGFAWADNSGAAQYTPNTFYAHNSAAGPITARRTATGTYSVSWEGLVKNGPETVMVTAYGAANRFCRIDYWGMETATEFRVYLHCYDPSGSLADARFDIIVIE